MDVRLDVKKVSAIKEWTIEKIIVYSDIE